MIKTTVCCEEEWVQKTISHNNKMMKKENNINENGGVLVRGRFQPVMSLSVSRDEKYTNSWRDIRHFVIWCNF